MPKYQRTPPPSRCQNGQFVTPSGYSPAAVPSSRVALESRSTRTRCCSEAGIPGQATVRAGRRKKKGVKKREKSQTPKRGKSSCFRTAFLNSLGLQSRLEGQMADERSLLRSYSITAACLHASGAGSAQRTWGKRLALPPSPEASPPPGRTAARSRPRWEPGYFPRSFTTSKKAPG